MSFTTFHFEGQSYHHIRDPTIEMTKAFHSQYSESWNAELKTAGMLRKQQGCIWASYLWSIQLTTWKSVLDPQRRVFSSDEEDHPICSGKQISDAMQVGKWDKVKFSRFPLYSVYMASLNIAVHRTKGVDQELQNWTYINISTLVKNIGCTLVNVSKKVVKVLWFYSFRNHLERKSSVNAKDWNRVAFVQKYFLVWVRYNCLFRTFSGGNHTCAPLQYHYICCEHMRKFVLTF